MVSGSIYLRITSVCAPQEIVIDVKGVEKVSWKDRETHQVDGRQEQREVKRRDKRDIFRYKNPCFVFQAPQLIPGDYSIPFSFMMPANLPSSFQFIDQHNWQRPKGKVKYSIKAMMMDHHKK